LRHNGEQHEQAGLDKPLKASAGWGQRTFIAKYTFTTYKCFEPVSLDRVALRLQFKDSTSL
jgi:hypothetical protein